MGRGWRAGGEWKRTRDRERKASRPRFLLGSTRRPGGPARVGAGLVGAGAAAVARGAASLVPLLQQQEVHLLERGALLGVPPPAAQHQLVHGVGADGRLREVSLPERKERNKRKKRPLGRGAGRAGGLPGACLFALETSGRADPFLDPKTLKPASPLLPLRLVLLPGPLGQDLLMATGWGRPSHTHGEREA